MLPLIGFLTYLLFCFLVALAVKSRPSGFWLTFILCILFTPLLIAIFALLFDRKNYQN